MTLRTYDVQQLHLPRVRGEVHACILCGSSVSVEVVSQEIDLELDGRNVIVHVTSVVAFAGLGGIGREANDFKCIEKLCGSLRSDKLFLTI